tara:strand:+ start:472 stop:1323 length:852 start_codon:yes stop_codon:yes gene_type:complete
MILTDSSSARIQSSVVTSIVSISPTFLQFMQYAALTVSSAISGTIGLVKNGTAQLTLSGTCTYTGATQINAGTLAITSASTLNGVISGAGSLTKTGTAILTIGGNNTYSGGTSFVASGIANYILYSSSNAFGSGLFTLTGGSGRIDTSAIVTLPNDFLISGTSLQYRTLVATSTITVTGNIAGTGNISKTGNGIIDLQGTLTYTGSTTITAGTIRAYKTVGASTATASFTAGLSVSFNVPPTAGMTFRFFQGTTTNSYASVTLVGAPGRTGVYTSATSTLTIA